MAPPVWPLVHACVVVLMGLCLLAMPAIRKAALEYSAVYRWSGWFMVVSGVVLAVVYLRNPLNVAGLLLRFFDSKPGEWFWRLASIGIRPTARATHDPEKPPEIAMIEAPSYEEMQRQQKREEKE